MNGACLHYLSPELHQILKFISLSSSEAVQNSEFQDFFHTHYHSLGSIQVCDDAICLVRQALHYPKGEFNLQTFLLERLLSNPWTPAELCEYIYLGVPSKVLLPILSSLYLVKQKNRALDELVQLWNSIFEEKIEFETITKTMTSLP